MIDLKNRYEVLIKKVQHLGNRITELEEENFKLKRAKDEGVGDKMKKAEKEIDQLKADLARAKEDHQFDNLIHAKEIKEIRKGKKK